jgi:predicted RNA-binding protein associated with RNAse of E/G family
VTEAVSKPASERLLPPGSTAVRRDVFRGRVWTQGPLRVLESGASAVTAALWPGVVTLAAARFVESGGDRDKALRADSLDALASGEWDMAEWTWRWNSVVTEVVSERWFTVARMYGEDGALAYWYVNFERPPTWHTSGWDTMDLALDLVVEPDGAWHWKDEDEYAQCRRLGVITDAEHAAVARAREQAVALVEARAGVFGEDPARPWLPDPAWPRPTFTNL